MVVMRILYMIRGRRYIPKYKPANDIEPVQYPCKISRRGYRRYNNRKGGAPASIKRNPLFFFAAFW
jgi:hypothetical protein